MSIWKAQVGSENGHRWCCLLFLLLFLCWFPDNSRQLCLDSLGNLGPWPIGFTIWIQWPVAQLRCIWQSATLCGIYLSMRKHYGYFPQLIRCFWLLYPDFSVFIHINYFIIILCSIFSHWQPKTNHFAFFCWLTEHPHFIHELLGQNWVVLRASYFC
jgi:hypothetical protein